MRERSLRSVLLVKAVEEADRSGALITAAERISAAKEARRNQMSPDGVDGADALNGGAQRMLAQRAEILGGRLLERHPFIAAVRDASGGPMLVSVLVLVLALVLGFGLSALDGTRVINLLAPGLIGLVIWNFAVYGLLMFRAFRYRRSARGRPIARIFAHNATATMMKLIARSASFNAPLAEALKTYSREWLDAARPLLLARATRLIHIAAAAVGIGLIAGLYARGMAVNFQAGWESTFLDATQVRTIFQILYGPASLLTGIALPTTTQVEAMHLSESGGAIVGGESAAKWIHLIAASVALYVVGPRVALVGMASAAIMRWSWRLPLPASLPAYFRNVFGAVDSSIGHGIVMVAPYAHAVDAAAIARMRELLPAAFGRDLAVDLREPIAYGGEEEFVRHLTDRGGAIADVVVVLFNLAATPEEENHGALLVSVREWIASTRRNAQLVVLLDAGPYAARMGTQSGRIDERRRAWETFTADRGLAACTVDLGSPIDDDDAAVTLLRKSLWQPA